MSEGVWSYRKAEVKDTVKLNLPKGWKLRVCEVTSGDSGKSYWCQILWDDKGNLVLTACQCPEGFFRIPLTGQPCCKHVRSYLEFRKDKKS